MSISQLMLAVTLSMGFYSANAWDIAVALEDHIQFRNVNGTVVDYASGGMKGVYGLGYNAHQRRLFFVDNEMLNGSVFELTLPAVLEEDQGQAKPRAIVKKQKRNVQGIAYDVLTNKLYWANGLGHAIHWLRVGDVDNARAGKVLNIQGDMRNQVPMGLAIDKCRRYLYWTNCNLRSPSIERVKMDGSQRQVIISEHLRSPAAITVDLFTDKIYWADLMLWDGRNFVIESADMDGKNRRIVYTGIKRIESWISLTTSSNYIFWTDSVHKALWRTLLNTTDTSAPEQVMRYHKSPRGLLSKQSGELTSDYCSPITQFQAAGW